MRKSVQATMELTAKAGIDKSSLDELAKEIATAVASAVKTGLARGDLSGVKSYLGDLRGSVQNFASNTPATDLRGWSTINQSFGMLDRYDAATNARMRAQATVYQNLASAAEGGTTADGRRLASQARTVSNLYRSDANYWKEGYREANSALVPEAALGWFQNDARKRLTYVKGQMTRYDNGNAKFGRSEYEALISERREIERAVFQSEQRITQIKAQESEKRIRQAEKEAREEKKVQQSSQRDADALGRAGWRASLGNRAYNDTVADHQARGLIYGRAQQAMAGNYSYKSSGQVQEDIDRLMSLGFMSRTDAKTMGIGREDYREHLYQSRQSLSFLNEQKRGLEAYEDLSPWRKLMSKVGGLTPQQAGQSSATDAFHAVNHRVTNVAQLLGTSLYGMGLFGLTGAFVGSTIQSESEKEQQVLTMAGLLNTNRTYRNPNGTRMSPGQSFQQARIGGDAMYDMIRKAAIASPLTQAELTDFTVGGYASGAKSGLGPREVIYAANMLGTIGRASGYQQKDVAQDIRSLLMYGGKVDGSNKTALMLGIDAKGRDAAMEKGPEGFLAYLKDKLKGFEPMMDEFANSFQGKWSTFMDKLQQVGRKFGEDFIPAILPHLDDFSKSLDEWTKSGKMKQFADSMASGLSAFGGVLEGVVGFLADKVTSPVSLLVSGITAAIGGMMSKALIGRFVESLIKLDNPLTTATGAVGLFGVAVGLLIEKLNAGIKETSKQADDVLAFSEAGGPQARAAATKALSSMSLEQLVSSQGANQNASNPVIVEARKQRDIVNTLWNTNDDGVRSRYNSKDEFHKAVVSGKEDNTEVGVLNFGRSVAEGPGGKIMDSVLPGSSGALANMSTISANRQALIAQRAKIRNLRDKYPDMYNAAVEDAMTGGDIKREMGAGLYARMIKRGMAMGLSAKDIALFANPGSAGTDHYGTATGASINDLDHYGNPTPEAKALRARRLQVTNTLRKALEAEQDASVMGTGSKGLPPKDAKKGPGMSYTTGTVAADTSGEENRIERLQLQREGLQMRLDSIGTDTYQQLEERKRVLRQLAANQYETIYANQALQIKQRGTVQAYISGNAVSDFSGVSAIKAGTGQLRDRVLAQFPGTSVGWEEHRPNTANTSKPSMHTFGAAIDVMGKPGSADLRAKFDFLKADPSTRYLIFNHQQYRRQGDGSWSVSPYGGPNPHTDHVHAQIARDGEVFAALKGNKTYRPATDKENQDLASRLITNKNAVAHIAEMTNGKIAHTKEELAKQLRDIDNQQFDMVQTGVEFRDTAVKSRATFAIEQAAANFADPGSYRDPMGQAEIGFYTAQQGFGVEMDSIRADAARQADYAIQHQMVPKGTSRGHAMNMILSGSLDPSQNPLAKFAQDVQRRRMALNDGMASAKVAFQRERRDREDAMTLAANKSTAVDRYVRQGTLIQRDIALSAMDAQNSGLSGNSARAYGLTRDNAVLGNKRQDLEQYMNNGALDAVFGGAARAVFADQIKAIDRQIAANDRLVSAINQNTATQLLKSQRGLEDATRFAQGGSPLNAGDKMGRAIEDFQAQFKQITLDNGGRIDTPEFQMAMNDAQASFVRGYNGNNNAMMDARNAAVLSVFGSRGRRGQVFAGAVSAYAGALPNSGASSMNRLLQGDYKDSYDFMDNAIANRSYGLGGMKLTAKGQMTADIEQAGASFLTNQLFDPRKGYSSEGSSIGGMLGGLLGPLGGAAGTVAGGFLGSLFHKKTKDPADEAYKKRMADLLSKIERQLRPQHDYYLNKVNLFNSASAYFSGRSLGYGNLGAVG